MKKIFVFLALFMLCVGMTQSAEAHAIWIESHAKATRNKPHEVKVYYGEYTEGIADSTQKWYSDLKDLEVWVISPSKKKSKLVLRDAATHLASSFVPGEDGIYYITTVHTTKDLGGTTKYEFSSVAPVVSGSAGLQMVAPEQPLVIIAQPKTYKTNEFIQLQAWKGGEVFAGGEVQIMSPEGWVKTVKTNDKGQASFKPLLKGSYVIETSEYKKETGEWNQKQFTHSWEGSTTRILVN